MIPDTRRDVRPERVLVVEDSTTQAEELRLILESAGFRVEAAADGEVALERLTRAPHVEVIVSDIVMPKMSGYELCRHLKQNPTTKSIPVLLLTSLTDAVEVIHALECGADGFLTKPVGSERLIARITTLLENKRVRRAPRTTTGTEVVFNGQRFTVESDREQILDLLVSTFEETARAQAELRLSHDTIRMQADRLKELSMRDETTGLHNRRYFNEQAAVALARAKRYGQPFTVMIADIDHFKRVNDRFSHAIGDEVLRRVGRILRSSTREVDIVARYGGEEFVVAFTNTSCADAFETCQRIRRRIEDHPWSEVHPELRVTMTIGLDDDLERASIEHMLAAADARLYAGKRAGRNQVVGPECPGVTPVGAFLAALS